MMNLMVGYAYLCLFIMRNKYHRTVSVRMTIRVRGTLHSECMLERWKDAVPFPCPHGRWTDLWTDLIGPQMIEEATEFRIVTSMKAYRKLVAGG